MSETETPVAPGEEPLVELETVEEQEGERYDGGEIPRTDAPEELKDE